jgi:streptomycin 6-kinase
MFGEYLRRWELVPDGEPIITHSSDLLPVRKHGLRAMLKVPRDPEEKAGCALMAWWDGEGAARVLAQDENAILLERAKGKSSLIEFARNGRDDEATRIICDVVAKLHAPRAKPLPALTSLISWFKDLSAAADANSGLAPSAAAARKLFAAPRHAQVLHGDIHHENILDFGDRGWLAIDPKGLLGERDFDYANIFCNPEHDTATVTKHFDRRLDVITAAAGLERRRLLMWILAWSGLSAAWHIGDGTRPEADLAVIDMAAARLRA